MLPLRRDFFEIPDDVVYLDGNSLGPLPAAAAGRVSGTVEREWGEGLIRSWNDAGWMDAPRRIGDRIAPLVGAAPGTVAIGDTLSIKVFQALSAALAMRPDRRIVLSDTGNFPSDLYIAQGLIDLVGQGHELVLVEPEEVEARMANDVAAVLLTHVDYRSGRMHDVKGVTKAAHEAGATMIWDLAHSAGAVPVAFRETGAEFAVGCTYKYLNAGPGAPAFIAVREDLVDTIRPALAGWLGHADPFAMERDYRPGAGIARMRVGTPAVIQLAALDAALDAWDGVAMADVRAASVELSERFVAGVERIDPSFRLASPRDPAKRGSHVSFAHPEGYAIVQALIARGVIGDFRPPDLMRFGFAPLYLGIADIDRALAALSEVMEQEEWRDERFRTRHAVT